ncbi:hypothetical protein V1525DRAFT_441408 [Lipomyces kononenkoae]|uniref:Uncharacterized protein n=1 Tax=Lipomyces kononenkoae TaxID=34357 RepID=A0ACC3SQ76_LIPKO
MRLPTFATLLFFFGFVIASAQAAADIPYEEVFEPEEGPDGPPKFLLKTKFLESENIYPPIVYNTQPTNLEITLKNEDDKEALVQVAGGALFEIGKEAALENITAVRVGPLAIAPHTSESVPYSFVINREPKDYLLRVGLLIEYEGQLVQYLGYNSTVSVQDPPLSYFDPQMIFLYVIISGILGVGGYYVYTTYVKSYIAPKKAGKKRAKAPSPAAPSTTSAETTSSAAKGYDESWIPEHHLRAQKAKPKALKKAKKTTK